MCKFFYINLKLKNFKEIFLILIKIIYIYISLITSSKTKILHIKTNNYKIQGFPCPWKLRMKFNVIF